MAKTHTLYSPVAGYSGPGPAGIMFSNGKATDVPHDDAILAYAERAGYGIDEPADPEVHPLAVPKPVDSRGVRARRGSRARDAAVDPQPGDAGLPTNAGQADPHGPEVVSPGAPVVGSQVADGSQTPAPVVPGDAAEAGDPDVGTAGLGQEALDARPAGNGSTDDWAAWAKQYAGATDADLVDGDKPLGRNEIRAKYDPALSD